MTTDRDDLLAQAEKSLKAWGHGLRPNPGYSTLTGLVADLAAEVRRLRADLEEERSENEFNRKRAFDALVRGDRLRAELDRARPVLDAAQAYADVPFIGAIAIPLTTLRVAVRAYREQTEAPTPATTDSPEQARQMIEDVTAEHARTWQTPSNGLVSHPPLAACQTCDGTRKVQPFPLMGDHTATQIACPDCQPTVIEDQP